MSAADGDAAWISALRAACAGATQGEIGRRIGYSGSAISAVLSGSYKGDLNRIQRAVEGALMQHEVDCPVLGELPQQRCVDYQRQPRASMLTNPTDVQLYRACRSGCRHSLINGRSVEEAKS